MTAMTDVDQTNVYRRLVRYCNTGDVLIHNADSALVLHHYTRRWDQWIGKESQDGRDSH
jgi:hypothetical protein